MQATRLTLALEAATLSLLDLAISSLSVPAQARERAGRLFFLGWADNA
jgi:hypothetical protein